MIATALLLLVLLLWLGCVFYYAGDGIPEHIPWANDSPHRHSRVWLYLRSILSSPKMLEYGYNEYSRKGLPFVFANLFTGAEVLLPLRYLDWVHDQPENVLSSFEAHREFMRADWTFLHPTIFHEHVFERVIKIQLTRQLDNLMADLADEARHAVIGLINSSQDGCFELNNHAAWKRVTLQVVSRIYVGKPLCRDQSYLVDATTFNDLSMLVAAIIGMMPAGLRPVLAPLVCLRDKWYHSRCAAKTKPIIEERLMQIRQERNRELPNDLITWAVEDALSSRGPDQQHKQTPDFLAARISMMNFVSIDSTSITIENTLYDILSHPADLPPADQKMASPGVTLLDCVREEARAAYELYHGADPMAWKRIINRLPILDACLKESLRMNNFISRTNVRKVMTSELEVPGVGKLPKGTNIGFSLWGTHHDDESYQDAAHWRMSRWLECPKKERVSVFGAGGVNSEQQYLPFGYRRHACPGRFFALRVVKLILVYLILFCDIEMPTEKRPGNPWLGVSRGPPMGGRLKFKRRAAL